MEHGHKYGALSENHYGTDMVEWIELKSGTGMIFHPPEVQQAY